MTAFLFFEDLSLVSTVITSDVFDYIYTTGLENIGQLFPYNYCCGQSKEANLKASPVFPPVSFKTETDIRIMQFLFLKLFFQLVTS